MSALVMDKTTLLNMIQTESRPCSGGWPIIVSHILKVNGDKVVSSYYSGHGAQPMPCLAVYSGGRYFQLLEEEKIDTYSLKEQLVQKYLEFIEYPEQFVSIDA